MRKMEHYTPAIQLQNLNLIISTDVENLCYGIRATDTMIAGKVAVIAGFGMLVRDQQVIKKC